MMRTVFIALCVAVLTPAAAIPQTLSTSVRHFDEGNRRYDLGDYEGAVDSYLRARNEGYVSGALFYNMGNAYYRMDAVGQAIRYYEKAMRYIPDSPELSHNLAIARERVVDNFSRLPDPFWKPVWRRVAGTFGPVGLFALGLVFYLVSAAAAALRIRSGRTPWRRRTAAVGVVVAACLITLSFAAAYDQAHRTEAVVLVDEVTLADEPRGAQSDLRIHEGLVVDVIGQQGQWSEIRLPNGAQGWLPSGDIGTI